MKEIFGISTDSITIIKQLHKTGLFEFAELGKKYKIKYKDDICHTCMVTEVEKEVSRRNKISLCPG